MKKLKINGIHRAAKTRLHPEGSCNELVNLRHREGAWETVGDKVGAGSIPGLRSFRFYHDLGEGNHAIIFVGGKETYAGSKDGNPYYVYQGNHLRAYVVYNGSESFQDLAELEEGFVPEVGGMNNVIATNIGDAITYFVFENGAYVSSNIDYSKFRVYRESCLPENNWRWANSRSYFGSEVFKKKVRFDADQYDTLSFNYSEGVGTVLTKSRGEDVIKVFLEAKTAIEKLGIPVGKSFYIVTIELFDGTEVGHTLPQYLYAAHLELRWYEYYDYVATHTSYMYVSGFCPDYDPSKGMAFKIEGLENIPKGLIKGVKIYMTNPTMFEIDSSANFGHLKPCYRPPHPNDWSGAKVLNSDGTVNYMLPFYDRLYEANYPNEKVRRDNNPYNFYNPFYKKFPEFDDAYYYVGSIAAADIIGGVGYVKFDMTVSETTSDISNHDPLPEDNFSRLSTTFFNRPTSYNGRLFLSNLKVQFGCGFSFDGLNGTLSDFTYDNIAPIRFQAPISAGWLNPSFRAYSFAEAMPSYSLGYDKGKEWYAHMTLDDLNPLQMIPPTALTTKRGHLLPGAYWSDGYPRWFNGGWGSTRVQELYQSHLFYEVGIATDDGEKVFRSPLFTVYGCSFDYAGKMVLNLFFWPFIFPDIRAKWVKFFVRPVSFAGISRGVNANTYYTKRFDLSPSPFHNFASVKISPSAYDFINAFSEADSLAYGAYMIVRDPIGFSSQLSDIGLEVVSHSPSIPSIIDQNRVQASALNNPFLFPAENSYRVGNSEIIGVHTYNNAMSEGQFGEYPVIAFTKSGIWALNIGQGETLVSSVVPLVNEVCNNPASITAIRKGLFFSTVEGLKILQGQVVTDISDMIEGSPENAVKSNSVVKTILTNDGLISKISTVDFKTYMQGASLGYDDYFEEIIVSNPAFGFSYVFTLENKSWTKRGDVFDTFLNQFPHLYAISGDHLYKTNQEVRTGKNVLIVTNPIGMDRFIKLEQLVARGVFGMAKLMVYASTDNRYYRLVSQAVIRDAYDIRLPRTPYSFRSFIIVFEGNMDDSHYLSDFDINLFERYDNKIR